MKLTQDWFLNEIKRWRTGEWCSECDAPLWVLPSGVHACANIPALQAEVVALRATLRQVDHYLSILSTNRDVNDKEIAYKLAKETIKVVLEKENDPRV